MKANRDPQSRTLSLVLLAAFFSLGFLSGCSNSNSQVMHEVIANKQATAEKTTRMYGTSGSETRADRSLWSLSRQDTTN